MSYARQLLDTYRRALDVDLSALAAAIDAITDCAQACIADTDADLGGQNATDMVSCIRLCLDCADVCTATAGVTSARPATTPMSPSRAGGMRGDLQQLRWGVRAARPDARALPGLRRGVPALRARVPGATGRPELSRPAVACGRWLVTRARTTSAITFAVTVAAGRG